jgi:hypothetical protein
LYWQGSAQNAAAPRGLAGPAILGRSACGADVLGPDCGLCVNPKWLFQNKNLKWATPEFVPVNRYESALTNVISRDRLSSSLNLT